MISSRGTVEDCWEFLGTKEIKTVNHKGNQPHLVFRSTDAEAESPILWPPNVISWLIGKDPDAGKDWRQKERRVTEEEIVGWHHQFNGHELGQILGGGKEQGSLPCCSLWSHKETDETWQLNNKSFIQVVEFFFSILWTMPWNFEGHCNEYIDSFG